MNETCSIRSSEIPSRRRGAKQEPVEGRLERAALAWTACLFMYSLEPQFPNVEKMDDDLWDPDSAALAALDTDLFAEESLLDADLLAGPAPSSLAWPAEGAGDGHGLRHGGGRDGAANAPTGPSRAPEGRTTSAGAASETPSARSDATAPKEAQLADVRRRNAAASRKSRQKRRAEEVELRDKNSALEEERDLFLSRIAELQTEVEALRYTGRVDLERENQLLRDQIRRHKDFVRDFFAPTARKIATLNETASEQTLILHAGLSSCIEQIVGFLHTSTLWKETPGFRTKQGLDAVLRLQRLPNGYVRNCKRWNLRSEMVNVPVSAHMLSERFWDHYVNKEARKGLMGDQGDGTTRNFEPLTSLVDPDALAKLGADIELLRYTETDAESVTALHFIATRQIRQLYPQTFLLDPDVRASYPESTPVKCYILGISTSVETFRQFEQVAELPSSATEANILSGHVIVEDASDPVKCHLIAIRSNPVGVMRTMRSTQDLFNEDGSVQALALQKFNSRISQFLEMSGIPSESVAP